MTITDIINKVYFYTKTNSTSLPTTNMLLIVNNAYERATSLVMKNDGIWQWDDNNQTDLPIATTATVSSQQDYTLSVAHLAITRVEIKDTVGNWTELTPFDQSELEGTALTEFYETPGTPIYYDKVGASVFLYPMPNYSQAASLKIYFQRAPVLFSSADISTGTKVPGFNSLYHDLIPLWASYDYAIANGLKNAGGLLQEIVRKEEALEADYARRNKDRDMVITSEYVSSE